VKGISHVKSIKTCSRPSGAPCERGVEASEDEGASRSESELKIGLEKLETRVVNPP